MTPQEYKDLATANGYVIGLKTDAELLADYTFHKAACLGGELVVWTSGKESHGGTAQGFAVPTTPARLNLNIALDGFDSGAAVDDVWIEVCRPNKTWAEVHSDGKLDLTKI